MKQQGVRSDITSPQNEERLTTAEKIANDYGSSKATVERSAKAVSAIEDTPLDKEVIL